MGDEEVECPQEDGGMFYVYIMTNRDHGTLYVGVTNDIARRAWSTANLSSKFIRTYGPRPRPCDWIRIGIRRVVPAKQEA